MAKTKKISINALDKIMKEEYSPVDTFEWKGQEVVVKKTLSFKEMLEFVDSVVKSCFNIEDGTYIPEAKDFALRACILEKYANFTLPNNLEHKYELIYCTTTVDNVIRRINHKQFEEIMAAINSKIAYLVDTNTKAINKQLSELYFVFNNIQKRFEEMFSGISSDDYTKLISALGEMNIDEEKLVEAFLSNKSNDNDENDKESDE